MGDPTASLKAFMLHLIDYAGLFPPAALPLEEALENYDRYRRSPYQWMLSRFIVPTSRLDDLAELGRPYFEAHPPFLFSVLGRGGPALLEGIKADLQAIVTFRHQHEPQALLDLFELRLPPAPSPALLAQVGELVEGEGQLRPFYEATIQGGWEHSVGTLIERLAQQRAQGSQAGFKLRCGGTEAAAFPASAQVAFALAACRDAGVPFKATAGLHHPLRHADPALPVMRHGFVNLFGAGLLAHQHGLSVTEIQAVLEDEEPTHFTFSEGDFRWQGLSVPLGPLRDLRDSALLSYGSCSFEEPRDDLQALGWL